MKTVASLAALLLAASAAPAAAQQALPASEAELMAEMLAMGAVCHRITNYHVDRDALFAWATSRMDRLSAEDHGRVMAAREAKIAAMNRSAEQVERLRGQRRVDADEERQAQLASRCRALTRNATADNYFTYSGAPVPL